MSATTAESPAHDEPVTRDDLVECLYHLNYTAKRTPHVVAKLTTDPPTAWDVAHRRINERIAQWQAAH